MMGPKQETDPQLFYTNFNLEQRIRTDHPLRAVRAAIDFEFVRPLVKELYGRRGNPSVDPTVVLKMMFLLFFEQVPSERALMAQMPARLDWLWFCGYDLDDVIPNHSVISKARKRWGPEIFTQFFLHVLDKCIEAGLVDGSLVHIDASILTADADRSKLQPALRAVSAKLYEQLDESESDDDVEAEPSEDRERSEDDDDSPAPGTNVCPTDPDARVTRKNGQTVLGYKDHRVVDEQKGIITATVTTDAATAEAHVLGKVLNQHRWNTGSIVKTAVADKGYGTADNYKALAEQNITPCIPHPRRRCVKGKFRQSEFSYDKEADCYICPTGQQLKYYSTDADGHRRYRVGTVVCKDCPLRQQCTDSRDGRRIMRHSDQEWIDWADECLPPRVRKALMIRRQIRVEGSFADARNNHGYKRARWRGLAKMTIQNLMIAAIQNLRKLLRARRGGGRHGAACYAQKAAGRPILASYIVDIAAVVLRKTVILFGWLRRRNIEVKFSATKLIAT
jgi:transposase